MSRSTSFRAVAAALSAFLSAPETVAQCLVTKVTADDAIEEDHFGSSVALSGDTLFVGAPLDNVVGRNSGSVYVFQRDGLNWFLEQKLVPPDAHRGQTFGANLAADGRTLVVLASRIFDASDGDPGELYV